MLKNTILTTATTRTAGDGDIALHAQWVADIYVCPAGQINWNNGTTSAACRPANCPHGRDANGWCAQPPHQTCTLVSMTTSVLRMRCPGEWTRYGVIADARAQHSRPDCWQPNTVQSMNPGTWIGQPNVSISIWTESTCY